MVEERADTLKEQSSHTQELEVEDLTVYLDLDSIRRYDLLVHLLSSALQWIAARYSLHLPPIHDQPHAFE